MNVYPAASVIELCVPLEDDLGDIIEDIAAVSYRVENADQEILVATTPIEITPESVEVKILIDSEINTLADEDVRDIRFVRLFIEKESGATTEIETSYGISADDPLTVGVNSFATWRELVKLTMEVPNLGNWDSANKADRVAALIDARVRICRMAFDLNKLQLDMTRQDYEVQAAGRPRSVRDGDPFGILGGTISLRDLTPEEFVKLPEPFRTALAKAQLAEANDILETDSITERRRQGLILETIGEVKQMFSSLLPPSASTLCSRAQGYLSPYLSTTRKITRV
jgi:hypothetical protein